MPWPKGVKKGPDGKAVQTAEETPAGAPAGEVPPSLPAEGTTVGKGPEAKRGGGGRGGKKLDSPLSVQEVQAAFYHAASVAARMVRSDAVFEPQEFRALAEGFVGFCNRVPGLRLVMVLLSPLSMIGEAWEKVQRIRAGMPPRKQAQGREAA